jgi:prepilin-type N-terminal cleavage/methylation domain-containing protein
MKANAQTGFTLWELLMTLLVAGILLGIGVPNIMEFQRNGLVTAAANSLITAVLAARAEAVKRQVPVTLCASPNPTAANPTCSINGAGTNGGYIVWVDENGNLDANGAPITTDPTDGNAVVDANEITAAQPLIIQTAPPGGTINVWANSGYISYGANGFRRQATGTLQPPVNWLLFCDDRGNRSAGELAPGVFLSTARALRIDPTGRGIVQQTVAEAAFALAQIQLTVPAAACP